MCYILCVRYIHYVSLERQRDIKMLITFDKLLDIRINPHTSYTVVCVFLAADYFNNINHRYL
jgi:hypothetical protein